MSPASSLCFPLPEHIVVDVDNPELTPSPYKVYRINDLEPADSDQAHAGTKYLGWNLEISVDPRELVSNDPIIKKITTQ